MTQPFEVDRDSEEYLRWVESAKMALEYGFTMSGTERQAPITNLCQAVALEYGVSSSAMEHLTLYL